MNVDFGSCPRCGAKNSKFVESCYKCGAFLPWASTLVARKTVQSQRLETESSQVEIENLQSKADSEDISSPQTAERLQPASVSPTANQAQILASLAADLDGRGKRKPSLPPSILKRVSHRVPVPVWGIALGVVGCIALGAGFGSRRSIAPAPPSRAPDASATPPTDTSPSNASTSATALDLTPVPVLDSTPAPAVPSGPTFDQLYTGTFSGTKEQRDAYWKTVAKTKVSWRGDFVQLGASPGGPLVLRCKSGSNTVLVTLDLSTSPPQTLPAMQPNQSIPVEGLLESNSEQGYQLSEGKVIG